MILKNTTGRAIHRSMGIEPTKGERTREQIISRALALAHHTGLEGISLGMLATDLNLSKSGLFAHFESKEALLLDVVQELVDRFIKAIILPAFARARGEPRIKALFDNYIRWVREHDDGKRGCLLTALLYEYADRDGAVRDKLLAADREWLGTLTKSCQIAIKEGHFKASLDAEQFAYELLGIFMVYQQGLRFFDDPKALDRASTAFASLLDRYRR